VSAVTFDARAYKETTRQQWQSAAEAWHRWGPTLESWLGEATEHMLDAAGVGPGARVLDVAAGAGGQSLAAARRGASVVATDISSKILELAAAEARAAGLELETVTGDGESLGAEPSSFDAVISRLGYMYFPDKAGAAASAFAALRPGGRLAAIGFAEPDRNGFFSVPVGIIRRRAELPPPAPGLPGPFSLAAGAFEAVLQGAGFAAVAAERLPAPLELPSAAECARFERESFGALHQMLSGLDAAGQREAWEEIEAELRRFESPSGFAGPCELLVFSAIRP
jgi:ubiquinone/menaquinone biosynthesis C-methylase UbiE